jgi:LPS sulfotransferase NodH
VITTVKLSVSAPDTLLNGRARPSRTRKLVLIGHARTGSTLLGMAIAQHPGIAMHGELFHPDRLQRARIAGTRRPYCDGADGAIYVREMILESELAGFQVVGLKLLYDQARTPGANEVWNFLRGDPGVHVIHIVRRNLLAIYVSFEVARRTAVWSLPVEQHGSSACEPFDIDPDDCAKFFAQIEARRFRADAWFAGHRTLTIEYERDLFDMFAATIERIWKFMGVASFPAVRALRKQACRPIRQQIRNFESVKHHFEATRFAEFFD